MCRLRARTGHLNPVGLRFELMVLSAFFLVLETDYPQVTITTANAHPEPHAVFDEAKFQIAAKSPNAGL